VRGPALRPVGEAAPAEDLVQRERLEGGAEDEDLASAPGLDRSHDARQWLLAARDVLAHVEMHLTPCRHVGERRRSPHRGHARAFSGWAKASSRSSSATAAAAAVARS